MSAIKKITLDIKIDICKRLLKTRRNTFAVHDFKKLLSKKFFIKVSGNEICEEFCEMDFSKQGQTTKFMVNSMMGSYEIMKNIPVEDEVKFVFYKHINQTYAGGIVEVALARLLEEKFPEYKQCSRTVIYKYVFNEYCKYKPKDRTYSQSFGFTNTECEKYLEYAIDETERKLCNTM